MLVSAIPQHESAIGIPVFPPSLTSLLPPTASYPSRLLQSSNLSYLSHTENSHWFSVLHMIVYLFPCYSLHSSHPVLPLPTCVSISLFSMSVSPLLSCKCVHQFHLSKFHICLLIIIFVRFFYIRADPNVFILTTE